MAKQYPNRSDLRNPTVKVQAATGQTYGEAGKQIAAQKAVPMGQAPTDQAAQEQTVSPGQLGGLTAPTQRPEEPISAGANYGEGPGPEVFGPSRTMPANAMPSDYANGSRQDLIDQVRYAYSKYPNTALFQLLLELEDQPLI